VLSAKKKESRAAPRPALVTQFVRGLGANEEDLFFVNLHTMREDVATSAWITTADENPYQQVCVQFDVCHVCLRPVCCAKFISLLHRLLRPLMSAHTASSKVNALVAPASAKTGSSACVRTAAAASDTPLTDAQVNLLCRLNTMHANQ